MTDESPVLETLIDMTAVSLAKCELDPREFMMARIAALVAVDASAASYLFNTPSAADAGVTVEDVQGVLIAVAPVVGSPRVLTAATRITQALGYVITVLAAESEQNGHADGNLTGVSN
jgi:alkylhydroperoxidase/carboxymuconolactone decarboxylase family protein YurZ